MLSFIEFLKSKDSRLINIIGEKDWLQSKTYSVTQVDELMKEYIQYLESKNLIQVLPF